MKKTPPRPPVRGTETDARPSRPTEPAPGLSRRGFLGAAGGMTAFGLVAGVGCGEDGPPAGVDPSLAQKRAQRALDRRIDVARWEFSQPLPELKTNGDEERHPGYAAMFTKGLPHDDMGHVDPSAYQALLHAVSTGVPDDFERIPLGGTRKLSNPQGAFMFELHGADSHATYMPPPPAFHSAEMAGELAELYWMALTRDIPYTRWDTDPLIQEACDRLSQLSDFKGPREGGRVTPRTLFRGGFGDLNGPYLSQFLLMDVPYGAQLLTQHNRVPVAGVGNDFVTRPDHWLHIQRGNTMGAITFDPTRRYLRSNRDLGEFFHVDVPFQAYLTALLIMTNSLRVPSDSANPYLTSRTQDGNVSFGRNYIGSLLCSAPQKAQKAVIYHKWVMHRRIRPEAYAGRVHALRKGLASYELHPDIIDNPVLEKIHERYGSYLLPMAFPEGSPIHPSYGSGHSVNAGVCVTLLKAFYDEDFVIPNPVQPNEDGTALVPYDGPPLTVGGELDKLAFNCSTGRNIAGMHFRSEAIESMKLGEEMAIRLLREDMMTFNESFSGWSLRKFDGTRITL